MLTDLFTGMLETARANVGDLPQVETIAQADAQALPYADAAFDAVIANHMLYHVADLPATLAELHRVLKPGGTLYATTIGAAHLRELWEALAPFAADLPARLQHDELTSRFSLENGAARLAPWFTNLQVRHYDDALRVTEVAPLIAFVQAGATSEHPVLTGENLARFRAWLTERIQQDDALHITKSSGIFCGRKK